MNRRKKLDLANVIQVDHGDHHTMALIGNGDVYAWGLNERGQLTTGRMSVYRNRPTRVCQAASQIACGVYLSVILDDRGHVHYCGQLSMQSARMVTLTHIPIDGRVIAISCGDHHIMAVTEGGHLFGVGDNQSGQLGIGHDTDQVSPQLILN